MKKIQKQLEKEKLRVEERRKEKAEAKAKRKIEREEAAKNGRKLSKINHKFHYNYKNHELLLKRGASSQ